MYENIFAGFAIDTNDPALADSFAPIPEAVYPVAVESIEQGFDKSGGVRFTAKVRIREGAFTGRVVNENYNLGHSNPQVVEIGRKQLAALARACGVNGQLTNPQQVVNVPTFAKIGPQKEDPRYSRIIAWLTPDAAAKFGSHTAAKPTMSAPQPSAFVPPVAPAFTAPAVPQPAAPTFVPPAVQPAAQPAFVPPAQPQPAVQPVVQPAAFPAQAAPQAAFPAQPVAQPVAQPAPAAATHKMPWEQ